MSPRELADAKAAVQSALASGRITLQPAPAAPVCSVMKYRERTRAAGLCIGCGGQRDRSSLKCSSCREIHRIADRKRYEHLLSSGLCTQCGRPRDRHYARSGKLARQCTVCRDQNIASKIRRETAK